MHVFVALFRMSSTLRKPDATALSAHRRAADQNAILCAAQQKRFGDPPRRARKWAFAPQASRQDDHEKPFRGDRRL